MKYSQRHIIPLEKCIVVLDTNVARKLGESTTWPDWLGTFCNMALSGEYTFALADGAFAELLNQITKPVGGMSDGCFSRMIQGLETFIDPDYPIILGKKDILGMLGINGKEPWCAVEVRQLSKDGWQKLCKVQLEPKVAQYLSRVEKILQEEREEWAAHFQKFDNHFALEIAAVKRRITELQSHSGVHALALSNLLREFQQKLLALNNLKELEGKVLEDALAALDADRKVAGVSMSARCDLQIRYLYRQWVRTRKSKRAYSPASHNNRNDGIDFDFYRFLMLPALVVTEDNGFLTRISDIPSAQKTWFMTPDELAARWEGGGRPRPTWYRA
ncbi:hypothetical protein [Pseudomonas sp. NPDC086251]|uniref:hypothetical protein n=1 Tax=Pseudomonas sp. NPDC086251 TaxID=3364431 RepID=UPI003833AC59